MNIRPHFFFLPTLMALLSQTEVQADGTLFQSGEKQTALVELFTSEGCSSCPPAEAWFNGLAENVGLWKEFVPVAFHVDYWDGLGWKDRFALPVFTQRQREYSRAWGSSTVYTPGFVVNGREQHGIPSQAWQSSAKPGLLKVSREGGKLVINFASSEGNPAQFIAHVALLGSGLISKIERGENSGRDLKHDFVVLFYSRKPTDNDGATEFEFPKTDAKASHLALAVWITHPDDLTPVQATGGWLR